MDKKLNLKIYGVTTVGPKGQVIIPKECREEYKVNVGTEFMLVMVDKMAFGIGKVGECNPDKDCDIELIEEIGTINIGTKFQFVISSIIRKELGIEPGDSLIVIGDDGKGLGFIKNDKIEYLLEYIKKATKS